MIDPAATAIIDGAGHHSYGELQQRTLALGGRLAALLRPVVAGGDTGRVAFLVAANFTYPVVQRALWRAGAMAIPLSPLHPPGELRKLLADAAPHLLIADEYHADRLSPLAEEAKLPLHFVEELTEVDSVDEGVTAPESPPPPERPAMMLYTSGTTGRPKGVVLRHRHLRWQTEVLVESWDWRRDDRALLVLPLHHTHGIVNVLGCALAAGATCEMAPNFDARTVWHRLASGEITVLMAVPTIWSQLIAAWEKASFETQKAWSRGAAALRLAVSGSAALPVTVLERWRVLSGYTLLERYGMTEIGMALSNPLNGKRLPGTVGRPLPGVETRIVDDTGRPLSDDEAGEAGELEVRGPGVFDTYWRRPDETAAAFHDGWFRTGDEALIDRNGIHRILGRRSVDILKCGGYKISALEVEQVLSEHPHLAEVAVCGLADDSWGERIGVAVVLGANAEAEAKAAKGSKALLEELRLWAGERLASYKLPTRLAIVEALPRNPLGKVIKGELPQCFEA